MKTRFLPLLLAGAALAFAAGCQSVESRIKEKPDVYANVDKATQDKIKQGIIDLGYTEDMVYIALGNPDQKRESKTASGSSVTWIYNTYYTRYEGTQMMGYNRRVYFDPYLRTYRLYYRPVFADTYSEDKEERIRIVFTNGKVSAIEQAKD
jgi:hypothetical protein